MEHCLRASAHNSSPSCAADEARARIGRAVRGERRMLAQVERWIARGDMRQARRQIRGYLVSYTAKLAALSAVNEKRDRSRKRQKDGKLGQDRRLALPALLDIAARMDLFSPSREVVAIKPIAKSGGRFRAVCMFEIEHRARQRMLTRLLGLFKDRLTPPQFLFRGRKAALATVAEAVRREGYGYAAELDVINQFGAFDQDALHKFLPELPAKSVRANLVPTDMVLSHKRMSSIPSHHAVSLRSLSRQGLPQGASSSPLVAEMLMAKVLTELAWENLSQVSVVIYADNVLVLGHTKASVDAACECLTDGFGRSAVGCLRLQKGNVKSLSRGVDFLGMTIKLDGKRVDMQVTARRWRDFANRLHGSWSEARCPRQIEETARSWAASASLDPRALFASALMGSAVKSHPISRRDLRAIGGFARRSVTNNGGLSLSSVMIDTPKGGAWRAIKFATRCN